MHKVYINGKYLSVRMTGVQRVAHEMVPRVKAILSKYEIECEILEMPQWLRFKRYQSLWGTLWEQMILPLATAQGILINFCNAAPVLTPRKQIVVMYDAAVFDMPNNYSFAYRVWTKFMAYAVALRKDMMFTSSEFSISRISGALKIDRNRIRLMRASGKHIFKVMRDDKVFSKLNIQPKKYVLAVGSLQPGKNFHNLLKAMEYVDSDTYLVIAGGKDGLVFASGIELSGDRYVHAGYVTDEELAALYQGALCFIQPSVYEGFGLPAAEAMALGTPIVSSNAASLPEVCGSAAVYFDPLDPKAIAEAINLVIKNENLRNELIEQSVVQTEYFDWDLAAAEFVELLMREMDAKHA
jgi:glycosyltransferase involved in cell wall biosynthesis